MTGNTIEILDKMLTDPFTIRDGKLFKFLNNFCKISLALRFIFMNMNLFIKLLIGLPTLYFGFWVYGFYAFYVCWCDYLDNNCRYDFSGTNFSLRKYFRVLFLKHLLFYMTAFFMYAYYLHPRGWICTVYSLPMAIIAAGYTIPVFDKRINMYYNKNNMR